MAAKQKVTSLAQLETFLIQRGVVVSGHKNVELVEFCELAKEVSLEFDADGLFEERDEVDLEPSNSSGLKALQPYSDKFRAKEGEYSELLARHTLLWTMYIGLREEMFPKKKHGWGIQPSMESIAEGENEEEDVPTIEESLPHVLSIYSCGTSTENEWAMPKEWKQQLTNSKEAFSDGIISQQEYKAQVACYLQMVSLMQQKTSMLGNSYPELRLKSILNGKIQSILNQVGVERRQLVNTLKAEGITDYKGMLDGLDSIEKTLMIRQEEIMLVTNMRATNRLFKARFDDVMIQSTKLDSIQEVSTELLAAQMQQLEEDKKEKEKEGEDSSKEDSSKEYSSDEVSFKKDSEVLEASISKGSYSEELKTSGVFSAESFLRRVTSAAPITAQHPQQTVSGPVLDLTDYPVSIRRLSTTSPGALSHLRALVEPADPNESSEDPASMLREWLDLIPEHRSVLYRRAPALAPWVSCVFAATTGGKPDSSLPKAGLRLAPPPPFGAHGSVRVVPPVKEVGAGRKDKGGQQRLKLNCDVSATGGARRPQQQLPCVIGEGNLLRGQPRRLAPAVMPALSAKEGGKAETKDGAPHKECRGTSLLPFLSGAGTCHEEKHHVEKINDMLLLGPDSVNAPISNSLSFAGVGQVIPSSSGFPEDSKMHARPPSEHEQHEQRLGLLSMRKKNFFANAAVVKSARNQVGAPDSEPFTACLETHALTKHLFSPREATTTGSSTVRPVPLYHPFTSSLPLEPPGSAPGDSLTLTSREDGGDSIPAPPFRPCSRATSLEDSEPILLTSAKSMGLSCVSGTSLLERHGITKSQKAPLSGGSNDRSSSVHLGDLHQESLSDPSLFDRHTTHDIQEVPLSPSSSYTSVSGRRGGLPPLLLPCTDPYPSPVTSLTQQRDNSKVACLPPILRSGRSETFVGLPPRQSQPQPPPGERPSQDTERRMPPYACDLSLTCPRCTLLPHGVVRHRVPSHGSPHLLHHHSTNPPALDTPRSPVLPQGRITPRGLQPLERADLQEYLGTLPAAQLLATTSGASSVDRLDRPRIHDKLVSLHAHHDPLCSHQYPAPPLLSPSRCSSGAHPIQSVSRWVQRGLASPSHPPAHPPDAPPTSRTHAKTLRSQMPLDAERRKQERRVQTLLTKYRRKNKKQPEENKIQPGISILRDKLTAPPKASCAWPTPDPGPITIVDSKLLCLDIDQDIRKAGRAVRLICDRHKKKSFGDPGSDHVWNKFHNP